MAIKLCFAFSIFALKVSLLRAAHFSGEVDDQTSMLQVWSSSNAGKRSALSANSMESETTGVNAEQPQPDGTFVVMTPVVSTTEPEYLRVMKNNFAKRYEQYREAERETEAEKWLAAGTRNAEVREYPEAQAIPFGVKGAAAAAGMMDPAEALRGGHWAGLDPDKAQGLDPRSTTGVPEIPQIFPLAPEVQPEKPPFTTSTTPKPPEVAEVDQHIEAAKAEMKADHPDFSAPAMARSEQNSGYNASMWKGMTGDAGGAICCFSRGGYGGADYYPSYHPQQHSCDGYFGFGGRCSTDLTVSCTWPHSVLDCPTYKDAKHSEVEAIRSFYGPAAAAADAPVPVTYGTPHAPPSWSPKHLSYRYQNHAYPDASAPENPGYVDYKKYNQERAKGAAYPDDSAGATAAPR